MAFDLTSISKGKTKAAPRIILLGVEKIGKSTWASQAPAPIFLPIIREQGIDQIDCAKFPPIGSHAQALEAIGALATEKHDYRTAILDSSSAIEPLVWDATCQRLGVKTIEQSGYGKGYVETSTEWRELQAGLDFLREQRGMSIIIIGHVKAKIFNDPLSDPYDSYVWDIHDRAANLWMRWADVILFATRKQYSKQAALGKRDAKGQATATTTHATGTDERVVYTDKRPGHPGGNRYGLPYELPLNYAAFAAAMEKAQ